jgi:uncharacterized membrane protein
MTFPTIHPAVKAHVEQRRSRIQDRVADAITRFAGSMSFVVVHVAWFTAWIALGVEQFPYGLLTMIVSLEAIFLSTFLLISQNRADERRQMLANAEWALVKQGEKQNELEVKQNEELIDLTKQILALTQQIHALERQRRAP